MSSADRRVGPRRPGQYGAEVVNRRIGKFLIALAAIAGLPLILLLLVHAPALVVITVELAAIATMLVSERRVQQSLDRRIRGVRGEQMVGAILDEMSTHGWRVMHDSSLGGRGNIDHIVIGPGGLFAIETKSRGGRLNVDQLDVGWLKQAYAQRKLVESLTGRHADCLLVFSRAYLSRPLSNQRGVEVLPARLLAGYLRRRNGGFSPEEADRLYAELIARAR